VSLGLGHPKVRILLTGNNFDNVPVSVPPRTRIVEASAWIGSLNRIYPGFQKYLDWFFCEKKPVAAIYASL
jgi:hypothetical protein